jgi:hypothetical protein
MKPSVGRIVHYTGFGDEQQGECYAAVVTRVHETYVMTEHDGAGDGARIDMQVFPPTTWVDGELKWNRPVHAVDVTGGGNEPGHGQWHWPERVE